MTLADSIGTMLKFGTIFGVFPFYKTKTKSFVKIPFYTYTILALVFIILTSVHVKRFMNLNGVNTAEIILYNIPPAVTALANLSTMFEVNIFKFQIFQAAFDKFNFIDAQLAKLGLGVPQLKHTNLRMALIPLPVILVSVYEITEQIASGGVPTNYPYYINIRIQLFITCFIVLFQRRLLTGVLVRLQVVNGFLKKSNFEHLQTKRVNVVIKVQDTICDLVEDFNELFGWNILLTLIQNFIGVLGLINTFLFKDYHWKKALFNCFWNIYITMQGILITRNCEHVTKESEVTVSLSYKCLQRVTSRYQQLREKFFVLAQQASSRCPTFTAAGFFYINYNMLFTFVNMITSETAVAKSNSEDIQVVTEWLLSHEEEEASAPQPERQEAAGNPEPSDLTQANEDLASSATGSQEPQTARSIKCDDCGKLFKNQTEVEFHAAKSGHENFSESTEEKRALTEDEKKEQLAKIEAKLKQRRMEREEREKQEALEREKKRIRSGKDMLEAKKKQEDLEIKKIVEQRKREKEEERMARQRVRDQIEQDKLARKAKFSTGGEHVEPVELVRVQQQQLPTVSAAPAKPAQNYSDVKIQVRLTNGQTLMQTFGAKEPLSSVRLYIEMNRSDEPAPFSLMTNFPKKVFNGDDYEKPLDILGLAPSAVLIVKKL